MNSLVQLSLVSAALIEVYLLILMLLRQLSTVATATRNPPETAVLLTENAKNINKSFEEHK